MAKKSKKYRAAMELIEVGKLYDADAAVDIVKKTATAKFDETIEMHVRLGVDPKYADQQVRGAVVLPNGTGKTKRVLVFAKGEKIKEATVDRVIFFFYNIFAQKKSILKDRASGFSAN